MPRSVLSSLPRRRARSIGAGALIVGLLLAVGGQAASASGNVAPVDLGRASSFSMLAGAAITFGAGTNYVAGDVGLGADMTGTYSGPGVLHKQDPVFYAAQDDIRSAYLATQSRPWTHTLTDAPKGEVVYPGVSHIEGALTFAAGAVGGSLVLDAQGDPDAVFILQIIGAVTLGDAATVKLIDGAQTKNVFWAVDGALTLGANAVFSGTVLTNAAAAATTGAAAKMNGRLFTGAAQTHGAGASFSGGAPRTPVPTATKAGGPFVLTGCFRGQPGQHTGTLNSPLTIKVTPGTPGPVSADVGLVAAPYYGTSQDSPDGGARTFSIPAGQPFDCSNIKTDAATGAYSLGLLYSDGSGTQVADSVPLASFDEPAPATAY